MSMKNKFILLTIWCIVSFIGTVIGLTVLMNLTNMSNSIKAFLILGIIFYDIILYKLYKNKCNTTGDIYSESNF